MKKKTPKSPALTRAQQKRRRGKADKAQKKEKPAIVEPLGGGWEPDGDSQLPPLDSIPIDKSDRSGATRSTEDE